MKKLLLLPVCILGYVVAFCQSEIAIIPQPVKVTRGTGMFTLPSHIIIEAADAPALGETVNSLKQHLSVPTGYTIATSLSKTTPSTVKLVINKTADAALGDEGYHLSVMPKQIVITANKPAGLFYGVQTLYQLLPAAIESNTKVSDVKWQAPCVEITDYPRFGWRGLMLDVSRHFFTKQQVKDFIDQMVKYKYNLLHMHLTDDEGWRIEIKSLPRLTSDDATKRVHKEGYFGTFSPPTPDEPRNEGGFYTQDDIRELVQYAKDRFVNIMPEVDIPGHSLSAIVAYPELSCTPGADKYKIISGEPFMDWPGPIARIDNTLCPANEKVYPFLNKVFGEIAQLFPFPYIHVGGDECAKNFWEKSDEIKALMQRENLKTMEEVQSYFEKRVEKIVESKGKKVIGWDEILEGGLAPDAAVMSWRGIQGGIAAAKMGHEVVMSPTTFAYLDYMQGDPIIEPHVYATLRLKKAYEFEPVPDGVDPKYIKGGQANIWTEQMFNVRHLEYMTWPRAEAIAECVWSPKDAKNWDDFTRRVEDQFPRFDEAQVKYARAMFDPAFSVKKDTDGKLVITLTNEVDGLDTYYSFDNSFPDNFYPKYTQPITPPKDAVMMKVVTYRGNQQVGRIIAMPVSELQKRADHKGDDE
ncbi:MAG TPA: family 20 glycosylhydrolase [Chitinophagaceae bacterium]|nr:family 20 glycosylhydrolase [Chitinophagaceae bacterium]